MISFFSFLLIKFCNFALLNINIFLALMSQLNYELRSSSNFCLVRLYSNQQIEFIVLLNLFNLVKINEFDQLNEQLTRLYLNKQLISSKKRNRQLYLIRLTTKFRRKNYYLSQFTISLRQKHHRLSFLIIRFRRYYNLL